METTRHNTLFSGRSIATMVIALIAVSVALCALLGLRTYRQAMDRGQTEAALAAKQLDAWLDRILSATEDEVPLVTDFLKEPHSHAETEEFLRDRTWMLSTKVHPSFRNAVIASEGQYACGNWWKPPAGYRPETRDWFKQSVAGGGRAVLTDPYLAFDFNTPCVTAGLLLPDGKTVFEVDIDLSAFSEAARNSLAGDSLSVNFVGPNGMTLGAAGGSGEEGASYEFESVVKGGWKAIVRADRGKVLAMVRDTVVRTVVWCVIGSMLLLVVLDRFLHRGKGRPPREEFAVFAVFIFIAAVFIAILFAVHRTSTVRERSFALHLGTEEVRKSVASYDEFLRCAETAVEYSAKHVESLLRKGISDDELFSELRTLNEDLRSVYGMNYKNVFAARADWIVNSLGWVPPPGFVISSREWYVLATQAPGQTIITSPYHAAEDETTEVTVARMLPDEARTIVAIDITLQMIDSFANGIGIEGARCAMILTPEGGIVSQRVFGDPKEYGDPAYRQRIADRAAREGASFLMEDDAGREVAVFLVPIRFGGHAVVCADGRIVRRLVERQGLDELLFMASLFVVAMFFAWFAFRRIRTVAEQKESERLNAEAEERRRMELELANRHESLKADAFDFILRNEDFDAFVDFFSARVIELYGCDHMLYRDVEGRQIFKERPGAKPISFAQCPDCPHHDFANPVYADGFTVMEDCRNLGPMPPIHPACPVRAALTYVVYEDGKPFGYLAIHYLDGPHRFTEAEKNTFNRVAKFLSIVVSRRKHRREVTDALELAESASRSKTSFLFNMSHDIRTPMNAIKGFTEIAAKNLDDREKLADCLGKIDQAGGLLLSLINGVLDMSRIESGKAKLNEAEADVFDSFLGVEPIMTEQAKQKGLSISFGFGEIRDRYVYADCDRGTRIFVNIVSNAIKYSRPNGFVKVRCEQVGPAVDGRATYRYTFEDNGIGMSEEFQKHVFEQFSRERNSTTSGIQGTGLGMALCKELVGLMGGTIACRSKQGEGTVFTVELSFRVRSAQGSGTAAAQPETAGANPPGMRGKRVLLVEDNEMNREVAEYILEEQGILFESAEDGSVAVDLFRRGAPGHYDFILMDIQMPVMGGYEATKAIRDLEKAEGRARTPIIALSANAFAEDREASLAAGMDDHIAKPIRVRDLMAVLSKFIG